jgi:YggT family protein
MLYQIPSFLLDVIVGLLGGACLLRLYMQYHRVPFGNPLGRFVFAITDWIVLPLRRIVPAIKRWDLASLIAAWLLVMAKFVLLWLLMGGLGRWAILPLVSLIGLLQLAVSGLTALLIVYAVLSWVPNASSMLQDLIARLANPLVRPLRRFVPLIGGVDLSPMVAIVLLQVGAIVLGSVMASVFTLGR